MVDKSRSTTPAQLVGARIREEIQRQGRTLTEVAEKIGTHQPTLSGWIAGEKDTQVSTVFRVAAALGVKPWELLQPPEEADLSPAWREVVRRIGDIDEAQVPAVIASIRAGLAALQHGQPNPPAAEDPELYDEVKAFLERTKPATKAKKKG